MSFSKTQFIRATKRLDAAEGYLELRMPRQALERLDGIGEAGPLHPVVEMLRGKALWLEHRYDDAVRSLQFAAQNIDAPHDRPAWLALSVYYKNHGQQDKALDSLARARGANLPANQDSERV